MITENLIIEKANKLWRPDESSNEIGRIILLSELMQNMLKRFAIVLTLLVRNKEDKKGFTRKELESSSQKLAERIAILYDINAPEAFDKTVFTSLILMLREQRAISSSEDGFLVVGSHIQSLHEKVLSMLPFSSQQQLQQMVD